MPWELPEVPKRLLGALGGPWGIPGVSLGIPGESPHQALGTSNGPAECAERLNN